MSTRLKNAGLVLLLLLLAACAPVGPDFVKPEVDLHDEWTDLTLEELEPSPVTQSQWWRSFNDPLLNQLIEIAWQQNNNLEIAGLRVLEARAQLGIAQGNQYPQSQIAAGSADYISNANNFGGSNYWQYGIGASASWEIDFWGRFKRGIESADAAWLASIAARDQALTILTAQVVKTYVIVRINEEQLRIANENVDIQQRSYDIASVLYRNGADSELDMQQAQTLLLSTQATIPGFETALKQAQNALSTLLGQAPGSIGDILLGSDKTIPEMPNVVEVGIPADLLRRRPDVRQAELNALAQNALVGLAEADLYPSFSLTGSLGLVSGGASGTGLGDLFSADALTFSIGPSFVWPFLNYGRIRNNIRVQDARLQQALVNYREVVIQSAREVEDAIAALKGSLAQEEILRKSVESAERSNELSVLRYREGFSDYQRVLDSQKSLFTQQQRLVIQRGTSVQNLVSLHQSLGSGWEDQTAMPLISEQSREEMRQRTNWGELLDDTNPLGDEASKQN